MAYAAGKGAEPVNAQSSKIAARTPDAASAAARRAAERLIVASRRNSAEYPRELANHLPMLLEIQARLGASAERLESYVALYDRSRRVPRAPAPVAPLAADSWRTALGERARESDLRRFFTDEVERLGWSAAIRRYVPVLAPGVGGSALHPLMRLAYGVLREDPAEIGTALGFWAATYLPLRDEPAGAPDVHDPLALLEIMRGEPSFRHVEARGDDLLWHWMRAVGGMDAFAPLIGRLVIDGDTLDRVSAAGLTLFAAHPRSLETVHAMTGAWWIRIVAPHLDAPGQLARFFWQAVLALYPKLELPPPPSPGELAALRMIDPPAAEALVVAALACDPLADESEHHPSAVITAIAEHARTGDPLHLIAAGRRMNLLD